MKFQHEKKASQGATLIEVMLALVIGLVVVLGIAPLLGALRADAERAGRIVQVVAAAQGRVEAVLADLSMTASPLATGLPQDFSTRYLTGAGTSTSPWVWSTAAARQAVGVAGMDDFRMETTVRYFDDTADGVSPTDATPHDALRIIVRIVPLDSGRANPYESTRLETFWYR